MHKIAGVESYQVLGRVNKHMYLVTHMNKLLETRFGAQLCSWQIYSQ